MSRILLILGIICILLAITWPWLQKLKLGHLPGDIIIKGKNFVFYFPITTMILISIVISLILWIINKFFH